MRIVFFIAGLMFVSSAGIAQNPNVLLIILDDVGVGEIPNYEPLTSTKANMPNLEALMEQGLTFDNVWSNPVCSPSRANILTGKHGFRTNVLNPTSLASVDIDEVSLFDYISETSNDTYSTSLIGKWHLGGTGMNPLYEYPNELGIEYFAGIMGGTVQDYSDYTLVENVQGSNSTEYITTKFSDLAIDWIGEQEKPWFCWLAYNAPHSPLHLPPVELHSWDNLDPSQNAIDADPLPYFLAMTESVDHEMGRVIQSIPADELENTVIIVVGDNGTSRAILQDPYGRIQGKGSLYQGGVHVPMVVSGVGVDRSNDNEGALVCFADLFSTIVELTGTELGRYEDSYSFYHLLSSEGQGSRDCSYTEVGSITDNNSGWASRDEQYKYLQWVSGEEEFYDLISDPYEKNNLLPNLNAEQQLSYDKLSQVRSGLTKTQDLVENELSFSVFPIPAKNYINIHSVAELIDSDYFIFNQRGEQIATGIISGSENQVNIEHLPAGKYYLQIGNGQRSFLKF